MRDFELFSHRKNRCDSKQTGHFLISSLSWSRWMLQMLPSFWSPENKIAHSPFRRSGSPLHMFPELLHRRFATLAFDILDHRIQSLLCQRVRSLRLCRDSFHIFQCRIQTSTCVGGRWAVGWEHRIIRGWHVEAKVMRVTQLLVTWYKVSKTDSCAPILCFRGSPHSYDHPKFVAVKLWSSKLCSALRTILIL